MLYLGIDPGLNGAIAFLDRDTHELTVHDIPVFKNEKSRTVVNMPILCNLMTPPKEGPVKAALEKVHAFEGQGIASAFNFGTGYGGLLMALAGHAIPYRDAIPNQWKKHFKLQRKKGMPKSEFKKLSLGVATQLFPQQAELFSRQKDDGRAEAALLALYASEVLWKTTNPNA